VGYVFTGVMRTTLPLAARNPIVLWYRAGALRRLVALPSTRSARWRCPANVRANGRADSDGVTILAPRVDWGSVDGQVRPRAWPTMNELSGRIKAALAAQLAKEKQDGL